jgi:tetratricopeptide (TPR) repeat protein
MWLEQQQRYEVPEEFNQRVKEDHQGVIDEFKRELGVSPSVFFFPYGDYGQYDEMARVVRTINLRQVGTNYLLGFTLGNLALNTKYSDRTRLNRLLVNPKWTARELADRLDRVWPFLPDEQYSIRNFGPDYWVREWGDISAEKGELRVCAIPSEDPLESHGKLRASSTTGAKAWLLGSDLLQDGYVSMHFQLKRGRFALYLRSSSKGEYIVFTLDAQGNASLRQKDSLGREVMLATDVSMSENRTDYDLLIGLRENMAYVRLNNRLLFAGRVLLKGDPIPGMIGVGVWDEVNGIGELTVFSTKLVTPKRAIVTWTPEIGRNPAHLSTWLHENSYRYSILAPPWMDVQASASVTLPKWDREMLRILAKLNKFKIYPFLSIRDASYLKRISVDDIMKDLDTFQVDGLYVDARDCHVNQMADLLEWLMKLKSRFNTTQYQLVLRLPVAAEGMASIGNMIKQLEGVILAGEFVRPLFGLSWEKMIGTLSVEPESGGGPLALYYQISDQIGDDVSPEARADVFRQKGFDVFALGEYEQAIAAWAQWSKITPQSSDPYALIGDAYLRMNRLNDALESYTKSLDLNPGQVDLAIRRSSLLEKMGRTDEQAEMLNLYARIFPETSSLMIAQAKWLLANKRRTEATGLMRKLVKERPEEIDARQILQGMLEEPQERYQNLRDLVTLVKKGGTSLYGFGHILLSTDLLATRESAIFFSTIREASTNVQSRLSRQLYSEFLPLETIINEQFQEGHVSDKWISFGTSINPNSGARFELRAGSDMAEAYLRLKKSDLMRDGFMEVDLDESVGFFWIYARRSSSAMIRFGFDDEGFLRIQSWVNGVIRSSDSRSWMRPPGTMNIRLEVRGEGARGFINGKPAFSTSIVVPNELRYGWWSVAPFSPELGMAQAKIRRIAAGPLPTTVLIVPPMQDAQASQFLDQVRPSAHQLSAVAPAIYLQKQDGTIEENKQFPVQMIRMFVTYHRLRYIPIIDASYFSELDIDLLIDLITRAQLSSLCICVRHMPSEDWFKAVEKALEKTSANLLVIASDVPVWSASDPKKTVRQMLETPLQVSLRQVERGNLILPPLLDKWSQVDVHCFGDTVIPSVIPFESAEKMEKMALTNSIPELNQPRFYVYPVAAADKQNKNFPPVELKPQAEVSSSFKPYVDAAKTDKPKRVLKSIEGAQEESAPSVPSPSLQRETERVVKEALAVTSQVSRVDTDIFRGAVTNIQGSAYTPTNPVMFHTLQTSNVPQRVEAMIPITNEMRRGLGELMPVEWNPVQRIERR